MPIRILVLIFFQYHAIANVPNELCPESNGQLYFSNGMFTSKGAAQIHLQSLVTETRNSFEEYSLSYNHNEQALIQILEVIEQKIASPKWSWFGNPDAAPSQLKETLNEALLAIWVKRQSWDLDLARQVKQYIDASIVKKEVTVVAHSQGNFYANQALTIAESKDKGGLRRLVSVATPDNRVWGNGPYITDSSDFIRLVPDSLPANNTNFKGEGHSFKSYLYGIPSQEKILLMINSSNENLISPLNKGYVHSSLHNFRAWLRLFLKLSKRPKLSSTQCLAIDMFLQTGNWWGEQCEGRSYTAIEKNFTFRKTEFSDEDKFFYDIPLYGLPTNLISNPSDIIQQIVFKDSPECKLERVTIKDLFSSEDWKLSLSFLKQPDFSLVSQK